MLALDKKKLRAEIERKLLSFSDEYIKASDSRIFERLIKLPEFKSAKRVFTYYSIGREVDTQMLMSHCIREKIPYALPRTFKNGIMDFCIIDPALPLNLKPPYGIPEPPEDALAATPEKGDIIIVPALCFDESLFRLGHGAGYYDRFLTDCPAHTIGLCREKLILTCVPKDAHDIPTRCLVSEIKVRNR